MTSRTPTSTTSGAPAKFGEVIGEVDLIISAKLDSVGFGSDESA
jgi:hypothetical protein